MGYEGLPATKDRLLRISAHVRSDGKTNCIIRFYEEHEKLFDSEYVGVMPRGNTLFLFNSKVGLATKLKGYNNNYLDITKGADEIKKFEGEYTSIHFDEGRNSYFVCLDEAVPINKGTPRRGIKIHQPKRKVPKKALDVPKIDANKEKIINYEEKEKMEEPKSNNNDMIVIKALLDKLIDNLNAEKINDSKMYAAVIRDFINKTEKGE